MSSLDALLERENGWLRLLLVGTGQDNRRSAAGHRNGRTQRIQEIHVGEAPTQQMDESADVGWAAFRRSD
jgi:hypothetical protein